MTYACLNIRQLTILHEYVASMTFYREENTLKSQPVSSRNHFAISTEILTSDWRVVLAAYVANNIDLPKFALMIVRELDLSHRLG